MLLQFSQLNSVNYLQNYLYSKFEQKIFLFFSMKEINIINNKQMTISSDAIILCPYWVVKMVTKYEFPLVIVIKERIK